MPVDRVDIAQKAAALCRLDLPNNIDDPSSVEEIIANQMLDDIISAELVQGNFRFALHKKLLSRNAAAPDTEWDASYNIPADSIGVVTVLSNDVPLDYAIFGDEIHCNAGESEQIYCKYARFISPDKWSPQFKLAVVYRLASVYMLAIRGEERLGEVYGTMADGMGDNSKVRDKMSITSKPIRLQTFIGRRRGHQ